MGAKKFSAKVFAEYFRRIFSHFVRRNVFSRFLVLEPHFEFGPAWGLGLTGWGLGAVAWGLGLRAEEVFGETFLKGLDWGWGWDFAIGTCCFECCGN